MFKKYYYTYTPDTVLFQETFIFRIILMNDLLFIRYSKVIFKSYEEILTDEEYLKLKMNKKIVIGNLGIHYLFDDPDKTYTKQEIKQIYKNRKFELSFLDKIKE